MYLYRPMRTYLEGCRKRKRHRGHCHCAIEWRQKEQEKGRGKFMSSWSEDKVDQTFT